MTKCILCNKKIKFPRRCPSLNQVICSTCCGIKKGLEIKCIDDCKYFVENCIKENKRLIIKLVKESFNDEAKDLYQNERVLQLVGPFEQFMFYTYYNNLNATDDFIFNCYTKMFYSLDKRGYIYNFNEVENEMFNEFSKIAKKTKIPIELQKLILVRLMKSVDSVTGGMFENKMYLELLRNQFTGTGIVQML